VFSCIIYKNNLRLLTLAGGGKMADHIETIAGRLLDMMPEVVPAYKIKKNLVGYDINSWEL
jgi:hypothetical protein